VTSAIAGVILALRSTAFAGKCGKYILALTNPRTKRMPYIPYILYEQMNWQSFIAYAFHDTLERVVANRICSPSSCILNAVLRITALSVPPFTCSTILFSASKRWHICLRVFHSYYGGKRVPASFLYRYMCRSISRGGMKQGNFGSPFHIILPFLLYTFLFYLSLSSPLHTEYYI
jgi:hypothetical protein